MMGGATYASYSDQSQQLMNIVNDLIICIQGHHRREVHEATLSRAALCISDTPSDSTPSTPLNERDCIQKIIRILRSRRDSDSDVSSHFIILYNKLLLLKINPQLRHSLIGFLLALADKPLEPSSSPTPSSQTTPPPTTASENAASSPSGDCLSQVTSARSLQNGNGLGYNSSQTRIELVRQPATKYEIVSCSQTHQLEPPQSLVMCALNSFVGLQGKYLKKDIITGYFKLDPVNSRVLDSGDAGLLLRMSELGYYHDRVTKFADVTTGFNPMGVMGQALICKLRTELIEYRGEVSNLAAKMKNSVNAVPILPPVPGVRAILPADYASTSILPSLGPVAPILPSPGAAACGERKLISLFSWYVKPLLRLQWLAKIADKCQMLKGGELASTLYDMLDNGNPTVNKLVHDLLVVICVPLGGMISKWMLEGGITDVHGEFFVEALNEVGPDRLWHDKFRLRHSMLPKFVPQDLADKILKTGKSINFLREVCEQQDLGKNRAELKDIFDRNTNQIFSYVQDSDWHAAVDICYAQTSKHVLDIMVGPHKLLDHLHGMRRYLLLGQGDFVSILIQHMKGELERNGTDIYAHDLSAMLDAALRCENAHHEDPEILNHLDVVLQLPFPGDCGWDIISLQYTVHGPLATMLEPTMPTYKAIFKPLWRLKHIEFVLSMKIWKTQMCNAKKLRCLNQEIGRTTHRLHMFTSEIMHFIHQMQYYILFEVIECNWVELQKKMRAATALDEILEAHEQFLNKISVGCFTSQSTGKEKKLETAFENIIALETWQAAFYQNCFAELRAREDLEKMVAESEKKGRYGLTAEQKLQRDQECKMFEQRVIMAGRSLKDIAETYEKAVRGFLLTLNSHENPNLQLFGTRLDFNEYYKKRDTTLLKPLTFEHMRQSNLFILNSSSRLMSHPLTTSKE